MTNIAIYSQKKERENEAYFAKVLSTLQSKNTQIYVGQDLAEAFDIFSKFPVFNDKEDLAQANIDYFFSFGGDGTMLSVLNLVQDLEIPVAGINMGRLGFLAGFSQEEFFTELDNIFTGKTKLSRRSVIEVKTNKCIDFPYALNDVTINRKEIISMITVEAEIDGKFLSFFWGDGLIVATPSGSTAYSLSCGGPIIEPGNNNFTLTPIAPHNLNIRPIILQDNVEIKLKVSSRVPEFTLGLDSRLYHMNTEDTVILRKASFKLCILYPENISFYDTLRKKLLWGNDKRN